ncbi:hypothetical protein C8R44DRAFT_760251, partial [Mycena epipterygia]
MYVRTPLAYQRRARTYTKSVHLGELRRIKQEAGRRSCKYNHRARMAMNKDVSLTKDIGGVNLVHASDDKETYIRL